MTRSPGPAQLSVALLTHGGMEPLRKALQRLRAQTAREQLEILLLSPTAHLAGLDPRELDCFHSHRIIDVGEVRSIGGPLAQAARAARSPVLAYVEEHSFPQPGWAAAVITAHEGPWAAVGATVACANPGSSISWASLFLDFSHGVEPVESGPKAILPSHQTSYKIALLLDYGADLPAMLESEWPLQQDLRARGFVLHQEAAALVDHVNLSRLRSLLRAEYLAFREIAPTRARQQGWAWPKRLLYIFGSPLVPPLRVWRVVCEMRRREAIRKLLPRTFLWLALGATAGAAGELIGLMLGPGDAKRQRLDLELNRRRHVRAEDLKLFEL